jgi:flagellar hook protein FlgE
MSFQQALSGLSAASTNLDTIGNNVANANTIGFKQGRAEFADIFASSLTGGANNQLGLGARVSQIAQQFTQGNLQTSNNPLDTGINGNGFFRMSTNGTITFSRDGQFQVNNKGYLVNSTGAQVTGYVANATGGVTTGNPVPLVINTADLVPTQTSKTSAVINLDSRSTVPINTTFSATDPTSYNNSTAMTVYDSLGNPHTLATYYQLQAQVAAPVAPALVVNPGTWNVYATLDGTSVSTLPAPVGTMVFTNAGAIDNTAAAVPPTAVTTTDPMAMSIPLSNGAVTPLAVSFDLAGSTQFGSAFSVSNLQQDGIAPGHLSGFTIGVDGTIQGNYSNGRSQPLGQVVLASFINVNGLQPLGNNSWSQTVASGDPLVGTPGSGNLGSLQSAALEQSNVDLTSELVNMITAQRVYQANAQTIKTQDQIMQTITSLR